MSDKYKENANRLTQQPQKRRLRVNKRRVAEIKKSVLTMAIGVALLIVSGYGAYKIFGNALDKDWANQMQKAADYNSGLSIIATPAEIAQANSDYFESSYSAVAIEREERAILDEYSLLISAIVENEKLTGDKDVELLDSARLTEAITDHNLFKKRVETDYSAAPEEIRLKIAESFYNIKLDVLNRELVEVNQRGKYFDSNTPEYETVLVAKDEINRKQESTKEIRGRIVERKAIIMAEKMRAEDGIQR